MFAHVVMYTDGGPMLLLPLQHYYYCSTTAAASAALLCSVVNFCASCITPPVIVGCANTRSEGTPLGGEQLLQHRVGGRNLDASLFPGVIHVQSCQH